MLCENDNQPKGERHLQDLSNSSHFISNKLNELEKDRKEEKKMSVT